MYYTLAKFRSLCTWYIYVAFFSCTRFEIWLNSDSNWWKVGQWQ